MTTFNVGDRVAVSFEGIVDYVENNCKTIYVAMDDEDLEYSTYVPVAACTKLVPPLQVGQEIGADSEEPPVGTLLVWDAEGVKRTASRGPDGYWHVTGRGGAQDWQRVRDGRYNPDRSPLTVLALPVAEKC